MAGFIRRLFWSKVYLEQDEKGFQAMGLPEGHTLEMIARSEDRFYVLHRSPNETRPHHLNIGPMHHLKYADVTYSVSLIDGNARVISYELSGKDGLLFLPMQKPDCRCAQDSHGGAKYRLEILAPKQNV